MTIFTDLGHGWLVESADHGRYLALCGLGVFAIAGALALRRAGSPRPWRTALAITALGMVAAWLGDGLLTGDFARRGFSSLGGVAGGLVAVLLVATRGRPGLRALADALAPGALVGLALARSACLLEGCDFGSPTSSALAVAYPRGTAAFATLAGEGRLSAYASATPPLFPFPLVEVAPLLVCGLALWALRARLPAGVTGASALVAWGSARGAAELFRHGEHVWLAASAFSVALLGAALLVIWVRSADAAARSQTRHATVHAPESTA